jgi:hypothetical protein
MNRRDLLGRLAAIAAAAVTCTPDTQGPAYLRAVWLWQGNSTGWTRVRMRQLRKGQVAAIETEPGKFATGRVVSDPVAMPAPMECSVELDDWNTA